MTATVTAVVLCSAFNHRHTPCELPWDVEVEVCEVINI